MSDTILLDAAAPVAVLTLSNPDKHNSLTLDDLATFAAVLDQVAEIDGLRALIITGTGKSFCAGVSLGDVGGGHDWTGNPLVKLCDKLEALPVPTIAALNGGVYGGGVEIALACDFRLGVPGMAMFLPAAQLGIHYPVEGLRRAVTRLGLQTAKRIFLLADRFDTDAIETVGFVDDIVPRDELMQSAHEMANTVSGLAPLAVQGMKAALNGIANGTLDEAAANQHINQCWASNDHREGLAAKSEKRRPNFKGN